MGDAYYIQDNRVTKLKVVKAETVEPYVSELV